MARHKRVWKVGIWLLVAALATGCGTLRQASSPDLRVLVREFGARTVPNRDKAIYFHEYRFDDDDFARAFKYMNRYGAIEELNLNGRQISDASISLILQFETLRVLHLQGTHVTLNGLARLSALPSLEELYVAERAFTADELEQLAKALPGTSIEQAWRIEGTRKRSP